MKYRTPEQLKGQVRNFAVKRNLQSQEVLQMFFFERVLERLSKSQYKDNFILKGGLLISSMLGVAERTTMDMDTTVTGIDMDEKEIEHVIQEILEIDTTDGVIFVFEKLEPIRDDDDYNNYRAHFVAHYGKIANPMKLDITMGDEITPCAIEYSYKTILDNEKIERAEDLQQVDFTKVNSESLEEFLKNGKEEAVHLFVEDYTKTLGKSNMDSFMFCQYMLINIQVGVMKFVEKMGVEKANIDRTFKDYKQQIAAVSTGEKAAEYIEELIRQAIRMRNERLGKKHSSLITEAKEFIVKNYQEETLSLSDVADQVGLSSSHFSTTFKQETGKSFVEFLTSVRMDKAKEMLCFTDMKASQISYEVGYKDPHYFSYLFKKTQGCTPSEYRSRRM